MQHGLCNMVDATWFM